MFSTWYLSSRRLTKWWSQARIQRLAKGEVVKIMENNVLLPQAANVSDRMPRKRQLRKHIGSYVLLVVSIGATTISHDTSVYYALLLFQDH